MFNEICAVLCGDFNYISIMTPLLSHSLRFVSAPVGAWGDLYEINYALRNNYAAALSWFPVAIPNSVVAA